MTENSARNSGRSMANFAFSALLFSLAGWASLEAALIMAGATTGFYVLACAPGLILAALSFRKCRVWWPSFTKAVITEKQAEGERVRVDVIGCMALMMAGAILASSAKTGSIVLVVGCAGIFSFVPWSRLRLSARHFYLPYMLLGIGAAPLLYSLGGSRDIVFYALCAWCFWALAASNLVAVIMQDRKKAAPPDMIEKIASPIVGSEDASQLHQLGQRP